MTMRPSEGYLRPSGASSLDQIHRPREAQFELALGYLLHSDPRAPLLQPASQELQPRLHRILHGRQSRRRIEEELGAGERSAAGGDVFLQELPEDAAGGVANEGAAVDEDAVVAREETHDGIA